MFTDFPTELRGGFADGDKGDLGCWPDFIYAASCRCDECHESGGRIFWFIDVKHFEKVVVESEEYDSGIYHRDHMEGMKMVYEFDDIKNNIDPYDEVKNKLELIGS